MLNKCTEIVALRCLLRAILILIGFRRASMGSAASTRQAPHHSKQSPDQGNLYPLLWKGCCECLSPGLAVAVIDHLNREDTDLRS